MPAAARVLDPTGHPGMITGPGVPNPPSPFPKGSMTVLIGGRPALRMGDLSGCGAPIVAGAPTVQIGG